MAPTICSGKKRQTRSISTSNIRRHEQGSHQLNQALSNIANFVSNGYINARVSASLRTQAGLNNSRLTQTSATTPASNHRRQQFSFVSDNAVTSSAHSDTENSFDLRLANEISTNDSTTTYSSNTSIISLSPSSLLEITALSTHKEKTSPATSQCQERIFKKYSTVMQPNNTADHEEDSEKSESDLYANNNTNKATNGIHFSNLRKHYLSCNDYDSDEGVSGKVKAGNSDTSENGNDADMDTDESDSMTSLDTEKSAKLKFGNNPLLRDKVLAKQQTNNSDNDNNNKQKAFTSIRNTDGLLSIAIKTIKLVKRNQLLQQRLTQLQMETSEFIQSVLANPENRHFRENVKQKVQQIENV